MEDTDDIFKDFEDKVKGKKESLKQEKEIKKPHEKFSEKDHLKTEYESEKLALEERYKKEMQTLKEKEINEKIKKGKNPANLMMIERAIYISIIVILLGYLIVNLSFFHKEKAVEMGKENVTATAVTEGNKTIEVKEEVKTSAKEEKKETAKKEENALSGSITLTIDNIHSEKTGNDTGYINQVDFTIDNGKNKVLSPIVNVYAYDDEIKETWETKSRGQYTYAIGIKPGDKQRGSISVVPKTFKNLDLKKNIRLALNDTESGFITAVNDAVFIS